MGSDSLETRPRPSVLFRDRDETIVVETEAETRLLILSLVSSRPHKTVNKALVAEHKNSNVVVKFRAILWSSSWNGHIIIKVKILVIKLYSSVGLFNDGKIAVTARSIGNKASLVFLPRQENFESYLAMSLNSVVEGGRNDS